MDNFLIVAQQVAVLFVLMGFGAAMRKAGFFKDGAIDGIVNVLILVVTPCLIIDVFQRPFDPSMLKGLGIAFAIAVLAHAAVILIARCAVRHADENVQRPLRLAAVFSNAGFMGIPLEQAVLGNEGVFYGIVYVVVFNLFIWSWGLRTMCAAEKGERGIGKREEGTGNRVKMIVNPGTVGLALGAPLFFCSVKLPDVLGVPVHHMANLNTPLAMIVIGYCLAGARFGRVLRMGSVYVATAIRLVLYPLLMIAALYPLRASLDRNLMLAMVIAASAPVAAMVSMFATKYRRDVDVSVAVVSGSTLLSVLTMPVVIALAMEIL